MKTVSKFVFMLALSTSLFMTSCAGYYVYERPAEPVYERPVRPYAGAVWVEGEWAWNGGRYVYVRGYWARPRGGGWVRGHWEQGPRGYIWRKGHWR
jgi:hypothetical protein